MLTIEELEFFETVSDLLAASKVDLVKLARNAARPSEQISLEIAHAMLKRRDRTLMIAANITAIYARICITAQNGWRG